MDCRFSFRTAPAALAVVVTLTAGCGANVEATDSVSAGSSGATTGQHATSTGTDEGEPTMVVCQALAGEGSEDICYDDHCEPVEACAQGLSCSIAGALEHDDTDAFFDCLSERAPSSQGPNTLVEECGAELPLNPACEAACARVEECHPEEFPSRYGPESGRSCLVECSLQETETTLDCIASEACDRINIPRSGTLGGRFCGCEQGDWSCVHPSLEEVCG